MAAIWVEHRAICSAVADAPHASTMSRSTRSGAMTAHSRARIPPMEPPTTAAQRPMPSASARAISTATWSRTVMSGNREPNGAPSGAGDEGPVVP